MVTKKISILLSTYNSEAFLQDQINSILGQTYKDWILYIRDDGSKDNTISIIDDYCRKFNNIILFKDGSSNLGAKNSFMTLLTKVNSPYYMFCDHDDVWLPLKIEKTLNKMVEIETIHPSKPILIFTDVKVVDHNLNMIAKSLWSYQKTSPNYAKNIYLLSISNPVTGCTIMINHNAKEISLPMSSKSLMHDLWIALKVSHYGIVDFIIDPTVLYRQHFHNVVGAKEASVKYYFNKLVQLHTVIKGNIKLIQMINSLGFKIDPFKRFLLKMKIMVGKMCSI